jgi:hypothetical protein
MYLSVLYVQDALGVPAARASLLFQTRESSRYRRLTGGTRVLGRMGARRAALAGFTGMRSESRC